MYHIPRFHVKHNVIKITDNGSGALELFSNATEVCVLNHHVDYFTVSVFFISSLVIIIFFVCSVVM